jgi:hypothetical protein
MKKQKLIATVLTGLMPALVALSPVVLADEYRSSQDARHWTIPPINKQWGVPKRSSHWTIPPINKQWGVPKRSSHWTIPRTADDMLSPGNHRNSSGQR